MGTLTVTINSVSVAIYENSFELDDSVKQASTLLFKVRDDAGTNHFTKGQPVSITDSVYGLLYTGFVATAIEDRVSPATLITTDTGVRDNHYLAEKRTYDGPEFTNEIAGAILVQLLNTLSAEGITAKYASRRDTTNTDFNAGTLSGVLGTTNVGDGDLELSLAGAPVTKADSTTANWNAGTLTNVLGANNALTLLPHTAIKFTSYCNGYAGTNYIYEQIWQGSYTIVSGDTLSYYMWVSSTSPQIMASIDLTIDDGDNIRALVDFNGILAAPSQDLSSYASDQWFLRSIDLSGFAGKNLLAAMVAFGGNSKGQYTAYFHDVLVKNGSTTKLTIFSATLNSSGYIMQNFGYATLSSLTSTSVVTAYAANGTRISPSTSLTGVGVLKNAAINWTAKTPGTGTAIVSTSLDGGATWQAQSNNTAILGILAGADATGKTLLTQVAMAINGPDPTQSPSMSLLSCTVNPSYVATKSDLMYTKSTTADFNAGTLSNLTAQAGNAGLTLSGFWRSWDKMTVAGQTRFGQTNPFMYVVDQQLLLMCDADDARSRFDFAGTWNVLDMSCDVQMPSGALNNTGLVYGCTNWVNANHTYAYNAKIEVNQLILGRGTNGGGGAFTLVTAFTLPANFVVGSYHTLRVVWNGTAGTVNGVPAHTHWLYIDGTKYISIVDATYTAAGYVGARLANTANVSGQTGFFNNFSIVGTYSPTTYVSQNLSLNAVGTVGDSLLQWNASVPALSSILVETTIDAGVTWQTATNGAQIPGLTNGVSVVGKNLKVRVTFSEGIGQNTIFNGFTAWVMSQFSSSGNRISPSVSLASVGRMGGSLVAWNASLPSGCTLGVDTRIGAGAWTDQTAQNGQAIAGMTVQPPPTFDSFDSTGSSTTFIPRAFGSTLVLGIVGDTHANYTSTFFTGGSAVTSASFDTAHSRLLLTGGSNALYIANAPTGVGDMEMYVDMDESDLGGLVFHFIDQNNFYGVVVSDGSSSGTVNTLTLFRTLAGTRTQVAQATGINFVRGTYHRFKAMVVGTIITLFMDGNQMLTYTDATPVGPGKCGMRNDTAGKISRYYQINIQPYGQDVSALAVQSRLRLASTNPLATPQVTDTTIAAFGTTIQAGALIPQTAMFHKYMSDCAGDLANASDFWWNIDKNRVFYFLPQNAIPAPWIASDGGSVPTSGDFMDANITVEDASDLYRNREIVDNVLAPITINENHIGDGVSTSWTLGSQVAGAPVITITNLVTKTTSIATVGVQNVDSGKQFYYTVGNNSITEDSSGPIYDQTSSLNFTGPGQYITYSQYDDTAGQAARAAIEQVGTGIVTHVTDGTGLTKAQGDTLAQANVVQYGQLGRLLKATTRRFGLTPGQNLTVFLAAHNIMDQQFLVRSVKMKITTEFPNGTAGGAVQQGWYTIEAISGPDLGDWTRLYKRPRVKPPL